ncbi:hypothetical protein AB0J83_07315 [Actinoplanes sp. NPDC049596]|uniref:hypothetical protein n=1 Tax=unclassified Actinoplanes TaxID=2626549 RepID=UPI0034490E96
MTAVLETAGSPAVSTHSKPLATAVRLLPWLFPAAALALGLLDTGVSGRDIALYAAYFALGVVVPGTLVLRAVRGSRGNLPEDLGLGAATGMLLLLAGWALAAAVDAFPLLPGWPVLIVLPFLAVPRLRRHWRVSEPKPLPALWSWIVAGGLLMLVVVAYPNWIRSPLPPAGGAPYQDLLYHLGLVHEMTRAMPFQVPQVAGETLRYHYLSDADIAAGSMITGIDPAVVLLRLWFVPVAGVAIFVCAALVRELGGKWWAGAGGGVAAILAFPLLLGSPVTPIGVIPISFISPSQTYVLGLLGLLILLAVDVLRGRPLRWGWLLIFPLALAVAGSKSSALPPLLAGLAAALLIVLIRERGRLRPVLALFGLVLAAVVVGFQLFAGGGAGTLKLQPLAVLFWVAPYRQTLGREDTISQATGVEHAGLTGWVFLIGLLAWWVVMQAPRMLGVAALGLGRTRREPASWLLAGTVVAGAGAAYMFWHPSASQNYFYLCALPFGTVLTAWLLADQARSLRPVIAGAIAGGVWAVVAPSSSAPRPPSMAGWARALAEPILITAAVALVVALLALHLWRLRTGRLAWRSIFPGLIAAVLVAGLAGSAEQQARQAVSAVRWQDSARPAQDREKVIQPQEMAAAAWLDEHAGRYDLVATNVHCRPIAGTPECDARAFWVSGLGGRRTLVESWGYTDAAVAAEGVGGKRYMYQPAPDQAAFQLNQRVFASGLSSDVAELQRRYKVRWLFGDSRAPGGVSAQLAQVATLRYRSGPVSIYELR